MPSHAFILMFLCSVAKQGTPSEGYERETWPELEKLARDVPEAGIHFQGMHSLWAKSTCDLRSLQTLESFDERRIATRLSATGLQS